MGQHCVCVCVCVHVPFVCSRNLKVIVPRGIHLYGVQIYVSVEVVYRLYNVFGTTPWNWASLSLFVQWVCCNFLQGCFVGTGPGQSGYVQRCGYQLEWSVREFPQEQGTGIYQPDEGKGRGTVIAVSTFSIWTNLGQVCKTDAVWQCVCLTTFLYMWANSALSEEQSSQPFLTHGTP